MKVIEYSLNFDIFIDIADSDRAKRNIRLVEERFQKIKEILYKVQILLEDPILSPNENEFFINESKKYFEDTIKAFDSLYLNIKNHSLKPPNELHLSFKEISNSINNFFLKIFGPHEHIEREINEDIPKPNYKFLSFFNYFYNRANEKNQKNLFDKNVYSDIIKDKEKLIDVALKEVEEKKGQIDSLFQTIKEDLNKNTASEYAKTFGEEAATHDKHSWWWISFGLFFSIILMIFLFFDHSCNLLKITNTKGELIYGGLFTKVLLISIAIFLISFSFKQYSIKQHLSSVNKHRCNSLGSIKKFVELIGKDDENAFNELVVMVAKSIYEQFPSGHISEKSGANAMSPSIVELTKMITKNSKT